MVAEHVQRTQQQVDELLGQFDLVVAHVRKQGFECVRVGLQSRVAEGTRPALD